MAKAKANKSNTKTIWRLLIMFVVGFLFYHLVFGGLFKRTTVGYADTEYVIAPSEEYIISILQKTEGIVDIEAVTENNDRNRILSSGGTSAVFFTLADINQSQFDSGTPVEKGTDGGGCIEVFSSKDDAKSRMLTLTSLSALAGYSKEIGTVVVRVSAKLSRNQQENIANKICEKLVSNNGQIEYSSKTVKTSVGRSVWYYILGCVFSIVLIILFNKRKTIISRIRSKKVQEMSDSGPYFSKLPSLVPTSSTNCYENLSDVDGMEGHDFEYWCADLLRRNSFTDVSVTQGSGDQGVDIIAKKDGIKYAIQCKCYSSDLGNTPVQEVHAGKAFYGCQVGAVMTNRYFTRGAQELAEKTGILLWDRDKITEYLNNAR